MKVGEGETACFWLEPTGTYRVGLRRFVFSTERGCAKGRSGCDADRLLDTELRVRWEQREYGGTRTKVMVGVPDESVPDHRSKLWPRVCDACGERFLPSNQWQAFHALGYVRSDTEEVIWTRHVTGPECAGALYDAPHLHEHERLWEGKKFVGEDGIALIAVCPNGHPWSVDGEATGGGHWTRTGNPRKPETLSVSPSIVAGDYHGFLTNGRFTAHLG